MNTNLFRVGPLALSGECAITSLRVAAEASTIPDSYVLRSGSRYEAISIGDDVDLHALPQGGLRTGRVKLTSSDKGRWLMSDGVGETATYVLVDFTKKFHLASQDDDGDDELFMGPVFKESVFRGATRITGSSPSDFQWVRPLVQVGGHQADCKQQLFALQEDESLLIWDAFGNVAEMFAGKAGEKPQLISADIAEVGNHIAVMAQAEGCDRPAVGKARQALLELCGPECEAKLNAVCPV